MDVHKQWIVVIMRLAYEVVRLDCLVDVLAVNADGDTHEKVLRALCDLAIDAEEI